MSHEKGASACVRACFSSLARTSQVNSQLGSEQAKDADMFYQI